MNRDHLPLIAVVNLIADGIIGFPDPDDVDLPGPWGPWIREVMAMGPTPWPWKSGPLPDPWALAVIGGLAGHYDDELNPFGGKGPKPSWAALYRGLNYLNPQPLPPVDEGILFASRLASVVVRKARETGGEKGAGLLRSFASDWCGNEIPLPPIKWPIDPRGPRPPRPEESLVLGARLVRASAAVADASLRNAVADAGRKIFGHGSGAGG